MNGDLWYEEVSGLVEVFVHSWNAKLRVVGQACEAVQERWVLFQRLYGFYIAFLKAQLEAKKTDRSEVCKEGSASSDPGGDLESSRAIVE
mmetsp:Transcript_10024/g.14467  ORF Transcript_10024/g.14467 Transcript_10024/m.14467 type:complete len:90 (+) Transcript_10024:449-718(+)